MKFFLALAISFSTLLIPLTQSVSTSDYIQRNEVDVKIHIGNSLVKCGGLLLTDNIFVTNKHCVRGATRIVFEYDGEHVAVESIGAVNDLIAYEYTSPIEKPDTALGRCSMLNYYWDQFGEFRMAWYFGNLTYALTSTTRILSPTMHVEKKVKAGDSGSVIYNLAGLPCGLLYGHDILNDKIMYVASFVDYSK